MKIRLRWIIVGVVLIVVITWVATGHAFPFLFGTY